MSSSLQVEVAPGCDARVFLSVPSTCKHLLELTKHLKEGLQTLVEMTKHLPCNDETLVEMTKHLGIPLPATGNVNALGYIKIHPLIRLTAAPESLLLDRFGRHASRTAEGVARGAAPSSRCVLKQ